MIRLNYENNGENLSMTFDHANNLDYLVIKLQEFISLVEGEPVHLDSRYQWEDYELVKRKGKKK
jgi:hypothetical protein